MSLSSRITELSTRVAVECKALWTAVNGKAASVHTHVKANITDFAHSHAIGDLPVAPSGTSNTTQVVRADDSRLSNSRTPSGAAGGSLAGTFPSPSLAAGAVNSTEINAAIKDAAAATASLRTLGTGAQQAAAGSHAHTAAAVGLGSVDNTADAVKPVSGPQRTAIDFQKYHSWSDQEYAYEDYSQAKNLRFFIDGAAYAVTRFCAPQNVEFWDYALGTPAWTSWVGGDVGIKTMLDGREGTQFNLDHAHRKFRWSMQVAGNYPLMALVLLQTTWTAIAWVNGVTVTIESSASLNGTYTVRDTATFGAGTTGTNWGWHIKATDSMHTGNQFWRVTIDWPDWVDSGGYTAIPIRRFEVTSGYQGRSLDPWSWDHSRVVNFEAVPTAGSVALVQTDDTRLSDARTPLTHSHAIGDLPATVFSTTHLPLTSEVSGLDTALAGKSPTTHGHILTGAEITGVLPIAKGGTGATTAAAALTGLGVTATAAELNKLDGATATTAQLNFVTGVTSAIQTQLNGKAASVHTHSLTDLPGTWVKKGVRAATTANITLSGTQTVDTVALVAGDLVLVKNQTTTSQNGIYTVAAGVWTRAPAADSSTDVAGATTSVDQGSQGGQIWTTTFKTTDTLGTTAMYWYRALDSSQLNVANGVAGLDASGDVPIAQMHPNVFHTAHLPTTSEVTGLFDATVPAALGTAAAGSTTVAARRDHVHPLPALTALGVTATAAELNKLDGATATVTELNYVDGVTSPIQTQLNGKSDTSHTHAATAAIAPVQAAQPATDGGDGSLWWDSDDATGDTAALTQAASLRAQSNLTGGGTVAVDGSYGISWSARFITIANGRGAYFGTTGYFDITMPANATVITGVGGAPNVTVTSGKITLPIWSALYYILPIGGSSASVPGNFRVSNYTANVDIPHDWILIAIRNGDNGQVRFGNGISLTASGTWSMGDTAGSLTGTVPVARLGASGTRDATTYLRGDNSWQTIQGGGGQALADDYQGEWNPTSAYAAGDIVSYAGKAYVSLTTQSAPTPVTPTWVGKAGATGTSATQVVTLPTLQAGDRLFAFCSNYNNDGERIFSGGAGTVWTAVGSSLSASGTWVTYSKVYTRLATAADSGASITAQAPSSYSVAIIAVVRGAENFAIFDNANNSVGSGGTASTAAIPAQSSAGLIAHVWESMTGNSGVPGAPTVNAPLTDTQTWVGAQYTVGAFGRETYTSGAVAARTITNGANANSGFPARSLYVGSTYPAFNPANWDELPFAPIVPRGVWEKIDTLDVSGENTLYGVNYFDNINTKYTKLKVLIRGAAISTSSLTGYFRLNGVTSAYAGWHAYHSTGAESYTTETSATDARFAYAYFYGGTDRSNEVEIIIVSRDTWPVTWQTAHQCNLGLGSGVYGSRSQGSHPQITNKITRIDLFLSSSTTWATGSTIELYGMVE